MKIVLAGGGTGGHFYPLIAVAEAIRALSREKRLVEVELFYLANQPYDENLLFENQIKFYSVPAGKLRRYFSILNFLDWFKTLSGIVAAVWRLYLIYPDAVFSKGGYVSFPVVFAARWLRIPVMIHESDAHPGRVNLWSKNFAWRIALAHASAKKYFPETKTAVVGNPIRARLLNPIHQGAREFLDLKDERPVLFITGGSQGSALLNDTIIDLLPRLLIKYQIIHQVGEGNYPEAEKRINYFLREAAPELRARYRHFPHLNTEAMQMAAGAAELIISRAGSFIFEIAAWGVPAIIVPLPEEISHDQTENAHVYAKAGAASIIEQSNLTPSILAAEIDRLMGDKHLREEMGRAAKAFAKPEAARLIAEELIDLGLSHEE